MQMNLSKNQIEFLKLMDDNPLMIFKALSDMDIKKPLIWKDSIRSGGKLGYNGIAKKYKITPKQARRIITNINKNINNG